jgi:hypothetical protein
MLPGLVQASLPRELDELRDQQSGVRRTQTGHEVIAAAGGIALHLDDRAGVVVLRRPWTMWASES